MTVDNSTQQANKPQYAEEKSKPLKSLSILLMVLGVFEVLAGLINLLTLSPRFSSIGLTDVILSVIYGVLLVICSKVLTKGKILAIWLFGSIILLNTVYNFAVGRGFNYSIAIFGAVVIWSLFKLKKQGELS